MKKRLYTPIVLIVLISATIFGCKKDNSTTQGKINYVINFVPAKTGNELTDIKANSQANIIKTSADFESLVKNYNTPFSKLSTTQLTAFRAALVFRDQKGIVSIHYGVLKNALNADDFAEAMSYFGIDTKNGYWGMSTDTKILSQIRSSSEPAATGADGTGAVTPTPLEDHNGYECYAKGTCKLATDYICLSGC